MDDKNFSTPIPQPKRPPDEEGAPYAPQSADQPTTSVDMPAPQPPSAALQDGSASAQPAQPVPQPASAPAEEPAAQPGAPDPVPPAPASAPQPGTPQPAPVPQPAQPGEPTTPSQPTPQPAPGPQPAQPQSPYGAAPQPQQPCPGQPPYVPQQSMGAGVKQKGTASLVCGIIAVAIALFMPPLAFVSLILGIVAIVLSVKAVTATGKTIKTTAGKVCGVVGIIISVIMLILIAIGFSVLSSDYGLTTSGDTTSSSASSSLTADASADEQAVEALAIERLDLLKNQDAAVVSEIAADVDKSFEEATDVSHADLGANAEDVARWMLTDLDYAIDSVYVNDDDTATVYADVSMHDTYAFLTTFYDEVEAWSESSAGKNASQSEAMAKIGEIYNDTMASTDTMTSYFVCIYLDKEGNDWVIDEAEWDEEMSYMFSLYG